MEVEHYFKSLWPAECAEECNIVEPPKAVTSPQTAAMKRHEAMPPRYCYEQPVARHRLHAMVTSASLRCLWVAARHRVRRCTGSTPPSSLPGGCTDCASFRASQSARWRKRLWLPPKTAHSRQPPSPPSSPQLHHHRICHRRRRRRQKLLVLDTVVMRRCRVRLCVPRGGARHRARGCTQVRCRRRMCCAGSGRWMRISSSTAAAAGGAR